MPLTDFLISNTVRKYNGADLRVFRLIYCLEQTKAVFGDVAECGVGSGYSLAYIVSYLKRSKDQRRYHGFDTFEGFPYIHPEDLEGLREDRKIISVVGHYKEFAFDHHSSTIEKLRAADCATLHKGLFDESLNKLPSEKMFSFVFIDCDLYQSYKSCLESIYGRVSPGGVVLFDEYEMNAEWPGARKAIDEFLLDKPEKPLKMPFGPSWYIIKI